MIGSDGIGPLVDVAVAELYPSGGFRAKVEVCGHFRAAIHRKDGRVEDVEFRNGVCNLGFNLMLDSTFRSAAMGGQTPAAPVSVWYIGLVGNTSFSALAATDTPASHSGWTEDSTHYTPTTFAGAVNNGGGYSAAATTMLISGVSQALAVGTPFTVVGSSLTHVVQSSIGGATPTSVTFTPGLSGTVANSAVISFGNGRPIWPPTAAASKSITNTTAVNFAMNTDSTIIQGIFVVSDPTLGGTLGLMWSDGLFGSPQTLFNGDILKVTYTVALS